MVGDDVHAAPVGEDAHPAPVDADLSQHPALADVVGPAGRWHTVLHLPEVSSTQDVALGRLRDGEPAGLVVVADRQHAGRGRAGRSWRDDVRTPRGGPANLAVTATVDEMAGMGLLPLVVGLAVADACAAAAPSIGDAVCLKWPNDVRHRERKLAGILVERHEAAGAVVVLVGCGVNVDWRGVRRDDETSGWISVAEAAGSDVDRGALLAGLLDALSRRIEVLASNVTATLDAYRARCDTLGRDVRVELPGGRTLEGRAVDVDHDGRLLVAGDRGSQVVAAGDVVHLR